MPAGRLRAELLERRVEGHDLGVDRQLAQAARDELGVLRPEIENDDGLMRHGHVRRESLLYVVVAATRPTYCGVLAGRGGVAHGGSDLSARRDSPRRKPRKKPPAPPFAALFRSRKPGRSRCPRPPARPAVRDGDAMARPSQLGGAGRAQLGERRHGVVGARFARPPRRWSATASSTSAPAIPCTRSIRPPAPDTGPVTPAGRCWRLRSRARASSASAPASRTPSTPRSGRELWARTLAGGGRSHRARGVGHGAVCRLRRRSHRRRLPWPTAVSSGRRPIDGRPSAPLLLGRRALRRRDRPTVSIPSTPAAARNGGPGARAATSPAPPPTPKPKPSTTPRSTPWCAPSTRATAISAGNATPARERRGAADRARRQRARHRPVADALRVRAADGHAARHLRAAGRGLRGTPLVTSDAGAARRWPWSSS